MKARLQTLTILASIGLSACAPDTARVDPAARPTFGVPELVYSWTRMEYDFRTEAEARAYEADAIYKKAPLAGVDVDRHGNVYVTTPRWLDRRVPSSLNIVVTKAGKSVLRPFPSWEQNRLGAPGAFQSVLGVEVDSKNRMWILDMGWVAGVDPTPDGAQKIVVLDLTSGRELARYPVPDAIADRRTSFLNDLTIDETRDVAYISDSGNRSGSPTASGIILYDLHSNTARRVLDRDPSVRDDPTRTLHVGSEDVFPGNRLAIGVNGITLSPDGAQLYWSVTTGDAVYSVPTAILLDASASPAEVSSAVVGPRRVGGGSDGMSADSRGRIYATNVTLGRVEVIDPRGGGFTTVASGAGFDWPDSLTWDDSGGLYVSTNHLNHAFAGVMDFDTAEPNFRIFRIQTDAAGKGFVR